MDCQRIYTDRIRLKFFNAYCIAALFTINPAGNVQRLYPTLSGETPASGRPSRDVTSFCLAPSKCPISQSNILQGFQRIFLPIQSPTLFFFSLHCFSFIFSHFLSLSSASFVFVLLSFVILPPLLTFWLLILLYK